MNTRLHHFLLRTTCAIVFVLGTYGISEGQSVSRLDKGLDRITYRLGMTRPVSHLFEVSIEVESANGFPGEYLDFQMPIWSPGRYAVFDFAKNVQEFRASLACLPSTECESTSPPITRIDTQTWRVDTRGAQSLTVAYKVFGNDLSGTFSQLDTRHANFNGASIFMYIVEQKSHPVILEIEPPSGWRIVNGMMTSSDQRVWQFPNYDLLADTPTEIAPDWTVDEFKVEGKTYRVVVHSFGDESGRRPALVRDIEKIVRAEIAMWGPPEFDTYTFLLHFANDDRSGDGMEHLTSTQIIESGTLAERGTYFSVLEGVAHEFFHVWNVKRLRPVELGPWDFTRPLATKSLWIVEGVTNYYGHIMQRRAGIWSDVELYQTLADYIASIENAQGGMLMSAENASMSAPFLDGGIHAQRTNLANSSVSYYNKGEVVALVLDLIIRGKTKGRRSLDDVMRRMYEEFYVKSPRATYYLRGRGFTGEDFERVTSEVTGEDMREFFTRYVRGVERPPFDEALGYVGLRLIRYLESEPFSAGISLTAESPDKARIQSVRNNSPAEDAGLQQDDEILSMNGKRVTLTSWPAMLNRHKAGDSISLTVRRDRRKFETRIKLGEPDRFNYRISEIDRATEEMKAQRTAWLENRK